MAWDGYWTYAGNEIINVSRTEAYAANLGAGWFKAVHKNTALPLMLGETYRTPLLDDAPWTDPDIEESYDFLGAYPINIAGAEDSTVTATVTESVLDGGVVGSVRHATRNIVFEVALCALSDGGAEFGMGWLRTALRGGGCGTSVGDCSGAELCFLSAEPLIDPYGPDDPEDCITPLVRTFYKATFTGPPTVTTKRDLSDGSAVWIVQFTVTCDPFAYGAETPVMIGFLDPDVTVPWAGGEVPDGGFIDLDGSIYTEATCAPKVYEPIYDPLCPAVIPPPGPPNITLGCYTPPANWHRRQFTIPKQYIPLWGEVVPVINVHAIEEVRNLRLRFYTDVTNLGSIDDDPCSYCGDIVLSYIPPNHTMTFDAVRRRVSVLSPGGVRRGADSLVFATDGTPFDWPTLSCGFGYIVTLDLPQTQTPPVVDLSLYSRAV